MVTQRKCGYPIPPLELPEAKFNGALDPLVQWVVTNQWQDIGTGWAFKVKTFYSFIVWNCCV